LALPALTSTAAKPTAPAVANGAAPAKPNVIVIITDQQYVGKLSFTGNPALSTPSMDRLARSGYFFNNAFCAYPLSVPSRFAMFSGRYPADFGVRVNEGVPTDLTAIDNQLMGTAFLKAGYVTYYGGKSHLPQFRRPEQSQRYGFTTYYSEDRKAELGKAAAGLIDKLSDGGKPFLLVASFINPHDICSFDHFANGGKDKGASQIAGHIVDARAMPHDKFYGDVSPQLPANFAPMIDAPSNTPGYRPGFSVEDWRLRRWSYDRLTENVDADIKPIIDVIERKGLLANTIVVYVSDHGDMDASHQMEVKSAPYNEDQKVPFFFAGPGIPKKVDKDNIVSSGVDLLPTLFDFAGIAIPSNCEGMSLRPLLTGKTATTGRDYIFSEGANWYQVIYKGRYKYTIIESPGFPDILADLEKDPLETRNVSNAPEYKDVRANLNKILMASLKGRGLQLDPNNKNKSGRVEVEE